MIVSDSTTLIILLDLKRVDLLSNLFHKIYIPHAVFEEITFKNEIEIPECMEVVRVKESELLHSLNNLLDNGESEAIALAKELNLPLIIDEKKGRKIAKNSNIKIIGLLGIVYINIKRNLISQENAKIFLKNAVDNGYRISEKLIDEMWGSL